MSNIYQQYQKLSSLPAGKFLFSKAIGFAAPFFRHIKPKVIELRPGFCQVEIADRWGIRNHLGTVNAGALCSLAELTGGIALDASLAAKYRWIPRGMTVKYLKKAQGRLTAISEFDLSAMTAGDIDVPISVKDTQQQEVFNALITFYVSEKNQHT